MTLRLILRLSGAALPVVGALSMGALAIVPGFACATPGHTGDLFSEDGGGPGSSNGGSGGGSSGGGSGGVDGGSTTVTTTRPPQNTGIFAETCTAGTTSVDWSPMRRISRVEYNNMVRDLLGDTTQPASTYGFPPESPLGYGVNFNANTNSAPSNTSVEDYLLAAEGVASSVAADTNRMNNTVLAGIPSCSQNHDDTCATDFIASWVSRAYRGQMDASESADLFTMYQTVKAEFDWTTGIQAIITAVLESPRFLYVMEFGTGSPTGKTVALSPYETAARLALFLWRSVPDATLMAAAAGGQLVTPQDAKTQAARMLALKDSSGNLLAQSALNDFTTQWMQLTPIQAKDSQFANFNMVNANGALAAAMDDEVLVDVSQTVLADNGSLTDLLTSTSTYANSKLRDFYNFNQTAGTPGSETASMSDPALAGNTTFTKTQFPNRVGILTSGAVTATQAHSSLPSFVLRGKLVRENVLCDPIQPPPPGVPAPASMPPDAGTTRDLLLAHQQKGTSCPGCHQYMDPIGVGLGNFDATGAFQATDANGDTSSTVHPPIDASGTIAADTMTDQNGFSASYSNAADMVTKLAGATQVRQCFALQELRYALGRIESPSDACSAQQVYSAFTAGNENVQSLILAIIESDAFRYRSVETAGSACNQ